MGSREAVRVMRFPSLWTLIALLVLPAGWGGLSEVSRVRRGAHAAEFLRGDATGDGRVSLADTVRITSVLFSDQVQFPCEAAADVLDSFLEGWLDRMLFYFTVLLPRVARTSLHVMHFVL